MPRLSLKFSLFSLTILLFSTQILLITCLSPRQPNFPQQISIPQYHNYSLDLSPCYTPDFSSLLIDGKESSPLIKLETTQKDVYRRDTFSFSRVQRPSITFNTSTTGSFKTNVQTFENNNLVCDFELTVSIFDKNSQDFPSVRYGEDRAKFTEKSGLLKDLFYESVLTVSSAKDFLQTETNNQQRKLMFTQNLDHLTISLDNEELLSIPTEVERGSPDLMFYVQSLESNVLSLKTCAFKEQSWDCVSKPVVNLNSKVTSLAVLANSFIAFITEDAPTTVQVYKVVSATLVPSGEMSCNSVLSSKDSDFATLYCISDDAVTVWDVTLGKVTKEATLDASSLGVSDFKPLMVIESPIYPGVMFIKTLKSIVLAKHYNEGVELLSEIQVPNTEEESFTFTVTGDQILILTSDKNSALQYSIEDLETPKLINECSECHEADNLESQGVIESSGYPLFASISNTNVSVYNMMMPGFMYTYSSIKLNNKPSKIMKVTQADRWSDMMLIYSAEANTVSFHVMNRQPRYISIENHSKTTTTPIATAQKPVSIQQNDRSSFALMVPQGYSPIGFALFIISIAYIIIIFIFIARRMIKTRRMQRIADEQAAILLPEGEGDNGYIAAPQGDIVEEEHMGGDRDNRDDSRGSDDTRYVAINNESTMRPEDA